MVIPAPSSPKATAHDSELALFLFCVCIFGQAALGRPAGQGVGPGGDDVGVLGEQPATLTDRERVVWSTAEADIGYKGGLRGLSRPGGCPAQTR